MLEHRKPNSPIFNHMSNCISCNNDFNKTFSILDSAPNDFMLQIKESLYIRNLKPVLNSQLHNLGAFYQLKVF